MQCKITVITEEHMTWPARGNDQPAGEAFYLIGADMSEPGEYRMTEMLRYKVKDEERGALFGGKVLGKTLTIACRRITTNKSGKTSVVGDIVGGLK